MSRTKRLPSASQPSVETHQQKYSSTNLVQMRICARQYSSFGPQRHLIRKGASRYSQITVNSVICRPSWISTGTWPRGLIFTNSGSCCWNFTRSRRWSTIRDFLLFHDQQHLERIRARSAVIEFESHRAASYEAFGRPNSVCMPGCRPRPPYRSKPRSMYSFSGSSSCNGGILATEPSTGNATGRSNRRSWAIAAEPFGLLEQARVAARAPAALSAGAVRARPALFEPAAQNALAAFAHIGMVVRHRQVVIVEDVAAESTPRSRCATASDRRTWSAPSMLPPRYNIGRPGYLASRYSAIFQLSITHCAVIDDHRQTVGAAAGRSMMPVNPLGTRSRSKPLWRERVFDAPHERADGAAAVEHQVEQPDRIIACHVKRDGHQIGCLDSLPPPVPPRFQCAIYMTAANIYDNHEIQAARS